MNPEEIKKLQKIARIPLLIPSLLYGTTVNIKNFLYDIKFLKTQHYNDVKIISIGNIAVGGTGKTPFVIKLAQRLSHYGKVCVITGNYPTKDKRVNVVSLEGSIFKKPYIIPDEAYMIAKKTNVSVISSKSRKAAIELALGLDMKYIILDDALHKRNIQKDMEICIVDKNKPFEDGFYLPAGTLRESKNSIKRCNEIICVNKKDKQTAQNKIEQCHNAYFKTIGIFDKKNKKVENVRNVFAFCGIGKPRSFIESLKSLGINVKGCKFFDDHHTYVKKDLNILFQLKKKYKAEILVTTYKDFVKMEHEDIYYLDMEIEVDNFSQIIERII